MRRQKGHPWATVPIVLGVIFCLGFIAVMAEHARTQRPCFVDMADD